MVRRILSLGAVVAVLAAAVVVDLWILKVITYQTFVENLGRTVAAIAVTTVAGVIVSLLASPTVHPKP